MLEVKRVQFLHFGAQCPWQAWMKEQAREAAGLLGADFETVDVTGRPELAARHNMFFPFLTVINGLLRFPAPATARRLVELARDGVSHCVQLPERMSRAVQGDRLRRLTPRAVAQACSVCVPAGFPPDGQRLKQAWAEAMALRVKGGDLGLLLFDGGRPVAALEHLPSGLVPYPLPRKEPSLGFITCVYSRGNGLDYRPQVMETFLRQAHRHGYGEVQVVAGRTAPHPNGPAAFFIRHGFRELASLGPIVLEDGYDQMVLLGRETGRRR
ncbi:MAG: hypothetical protein RDU89_08540 [bacterium]|nr:hypothetical protein [bacterium]